MLPKFAAPQEGWIIGGMASRVYLRYLGQEQRIGNYELDISELSTTCAFRLS
jgi:hypothetical protein